MAPQNEGRPAVNFYLQRLQRVQTRFPAGYAHRAASSSRGPAVPFWPAVLVGLVLLLVATACEPYATRTPESVLETATVSEVGVTDVALATVTITAPTIPSATSDTSAGAEASPTPEHLPSGTPSPVAPQATPIQDSPTEAVPDPRFGAIFFGPYINQTELPCEELLSMGIRSTFYAAWWGQLEPQPGQYEWHHLDEPVDAALACGLEPTLKIGTGSRGEPGLPPEDMDAYSRFVFDLVGHFKDRVNAYAIQNEISNPREVWTGETYGPLRAAAYEAIKRAQPDATVLDGGLTMDAYIIGRANELYLAGEVDEALAMLGRFEMYMRRKPKKMPHSEQELVRWLERPHAQRVLGLVEEMYSHPESYDAVQVHFLQDAWELIPEYVGWIKDWLAATGAPDTGIEFWEIGFGWEGEEAGLPFDEQAHAEGVIKTLVQALGTGADRVIYEPYGEPAKPTGDGSQAGKKLGRGLVAPGGPRMAATAHQTMVNQLNGYTGVEPLALGHEIWSYRFDTPRGEVIVVWAREETSIGLPLSAGEVTVTDISGSTAAADPGALLVSVSPLFVAAATDLSAATPTPGSATATPDPASVPADDPGVLQQVSVTVDGEPRTYHLYVPDGLPDGEAVPLVLAFHGRGKQGNGPDFAERTGFDELAEREGFIVAFPDGIRHNFVAGDTINDPSVPDDVKFVDAILDELRVQYSVDPQRIYSTGFSVGCGFSQLLAIRRSDRIAAIGCAGASLADTYLPELGSAQPFSAIMSCGSRDPFCGAPRLNYDFLMTIEHTATILAEHNGCRGPDAGVPMANIDPSDRCEVTRQEWSSCTAGTSVVLLRAEGSGHDWYRSVEGSTTQCRDIDNTELFWEFFEAHPKQN